MVSWRGAVLGPREPLERGHRQLPKPFVAFMDGIVMGGGVGISAHGSLRLVTERSQVAMPETAIGFFPDVGSLFLLSRAPGEIGTHLAMTGLSVGGADAVTCGLADALVDSQDSQD
jgi:enoyl-CoA hydratase